MKDRIGNISFEGAGDEPIRSLEGAAAIVQPNAQGPFEDYWDPWEALRIGCCSYHSAIDVAAIRVLEGIHSGKYCTDIAHENDLDPLLVEMLQGIFCSADWCEYGSSPRGCFPTDRENFHLLIDGWKTYYKITWGSYHFD